LSLKFRRRWTFQSGQNQFRGRIFREKSEIHDGRDEGEGGDDAEHALPAQQRAQELGQHSQDWSGSGLPGHDQPVVLASVPVLQKLNNFDLKQQKFFLSFFICSQFLTQLN
jgi:hypothetical protein